MREVVLEELEAYILMRQNTLVRYIATQQILERCEEAVRRPGMRVSKLWR